MNKKILLMIPVFLLQTLWVFAQDTYSYGFDFDAKGYDVIPITNSCPSADPLNEECVAVGTVYASIGSSDINNGFYNNHYLMTYNWNHYTQNKLEAQHMDLNYCKRIRNEN